MPFSKSALLAVSLVLAAYLGCEAKENAGIKLTGMYKCRPAEGTLAVKELPGGKVRFCLEANWTGGQPGQVNVGGASGIASVTSNAITYKDPDSQVTLKIRFTSGKAFVSHSGGDFGGLNVNPDGTYAKVSDRAPSESDLTYDQ